MSQPVLYFGAANGGKILAVGKGSTDDGVPYVAKRASDPLAVAGPDGEAIYTALYLVLTHREEPAEGNPADEVVVTLKAIVDGQVLDTQQITVRMTPVSDILNPPPRHHRVYEVGLSQAVIRDGIEKFRHALRGTFFQVQVEMPGIDITADGAVVECEAVAESRVAL